jgi:hypothetical protein
VAMNSPVTSPSGAADTFGQASTMATT